MRAGDVPLQPSEDDQKEIPKGGEDDPREGMVSLLIPLSPEESGGSQGDMREDPRDEMVEMTPLLVNLKRMRRTQS